MEAAKLPLASEVSNNTGDCVNVYSGKQGETEKMSGSLFSSMIEEKLKTISDTGETEQTDEDMAVEEPALHVPVMLAFLSCTPEQMALNQQEYKNIGIEKDAKIIQRNSEQVISVKSESLPGDVSRIFKVQNNIGIKPPEISIENETTVSDNTETCENTEGNSIHRNMTFSKNAVQQTELFKAPDKPPDKPPDEVVISENRPVQKEAETDMIISHAENSIKNNYEEEIIFENSNPGKENDDIRKTEYKDMDKPEISVENSHIQTETRVQKISVRISGNEVIQKEEIITKMADRIRVMVSENRSEMSIQLKPAFLGRVNLKLEMVDGVLNGKIIVQNALVRETVESNLTYLRNSLEQQGIPVSGFSVDVGGGRGFVRQQYSRKKRQTIEVKPFSAVYRDKEDTDYLRWNEEGTVDYLV